jgi:toxin ParE1/3/4
MPGRPDGYRLYPRARADLEEIWFYTFETWSADQADDYISEFVRAFEGLALGHIKGKPVDIRGGYFKYMVGSHLIFYKASDKSIDIVRILHQRMDVETRL